MSRNAIPVMIPFSETPLILLLMSISAYPLAMSFSSSLSVQAKYPISLSILVRCIESNLVKMPNLYLKMVRSNSHKVYVVLISLMSM